ncbi:hypothetical protein ACRAWD_27345 [Caulobacter segnis]
MTRASAESPAAFQASHELVSLRSSAEPPLTWKAWLKLAAIAEREPAAAILRSAQWSQDKARLPAEDVMFEEMRQRLRHGGASAARWSTCSRAVMRHADGTDAASASLARGRVLKRLTRSSRSLTPKARPSTCAD